MLFRNFVEQKHSNGGLIRQDQLKHKLASCCISQGHDASRAGKHEFLRWRLSPEVMRGLPELFFSMPRAEGIELPLNFQGMGRGYGKLTITCLKPIQTLLMNASTTTIQNFIIK